MSKNTVRPGLHPRRAKRAKRPVELDAFDAFTRRIIRAYARRVATGDVEGLRALSLLVSELDDAMRHAVQGLRGFGYSWSEIASRLGVTRQAAQMRYGERTNRGALDKRITRPGLGVTVEALVAVFADHHPGIPAASLCPGCGFRYPEGVTDCPTNAVVRPLLYRRRHENWKALDRLTADQRVDLVENTTRRGTPRKGAVRPATPTPPCPDRTEPTLLDFATGEDTTP
jgi:hypothetical protein